MLGATPEDSGGAGDQDTLDDLTAFAEAWGGGAIGASAAFNVTLTVSFLSGTLEVCFEGTLEVCFDGVGGVGLSGSLMTVSEDKPDFPARPRFQWIARELSNLGCADRQFRK